jgi:hypothetical protein
MKSVRALFTALLVLAAAPAAAQQVLTADAAKSFVAGKLFSFMCFEGTHGKGYIYADGSATGQIRFAGTAQVRHLRVPEGTLYADGDQICATLRGLPFNPCFTLWRTSAKSFRGAFSHMSYMYCDFTREGRTLLARRRNPVRHTGTINTGVPTVVP